MTPERQAVMDKLSPKTRSDPLTEALMDAAEVRAEMYEGDDRQDIKTDVMNAFYAGAGWAAQNMLKTVTNEIKSKMYKMHLVWYIGGLVHGFLIYDLFV